MQRRSINRLKIKYATQNSRVKRISTTLEKSESCPNNFNAEEAIEQCYKQIYFHAMTADREPFLESQLKTGSITIRDFLRGLLLSERFYRGYICCNTNKRVVQQVVARALGRRTYGESEELSYSIIIADRGFKCFIDLILNSDEFMEKFGYWRIPEQTNRQLPGNERGEKPLYQTLPRYADDWRDRLTRNKMMMTIEEIGVANISRTSIEQLIYEKPQGLRLKIWIISLATAGVSSIVIGLAILNAMFTIR